MFATRLYCAHARNQIGKVKARTPSVEEQRLEVARTGSTSVIGTIASVLLPLIACIGIFAAISIPGYGDYRTPIKGVYLCGGGTHPGGGVSGAPARNCATVVRKDRRRLRR